MTGAEALIHYRTEHADELERIAALKLEQAIELQCEYRSASTMTTAVIELRGQNIAARARN